MEPIRMTDKAKTKILPCSFSGCGVPLIVNKFESAARARCPDHQGRTSPAYNPGRPESQHDTVPTFNKALSRLACPFCEAELVLIRSDEVGTMDFKCKTPDCATLISITPRFGQCIIPRAPKDLLPLIKEFNSRRGGTRASETPQPIEEGTNGNRW